VLVIAPHGERRAAVERRDHRGVELKTQEMHR
jgi:hypothetical protein